MEIDSKGSQTVSAPQRVIDVMDEYDKKMLGVSEEQFGHLPVEIEVPNKEELLRNPYAE